MCDTNTDWKHRAETAEAKRAKAEAQIKLLVEALERIHRIAKEVSQVTALPTEMQQMADIAKQALAAVKE